jgi:hypothetical protein
VTTKRVKKSKVWENPSKRSRLESLLKQLEELISEEGVDEAKPIEEVEAHQDELRLTAQRKQDSSPIESSPDPLESHTDTPLAIPSESSLSSPETAEKSLGQDTPSSKSSDESTPLDQEELTEGGNELTESLTDTEMAERLAVKTSTLGKAKKRTDFSEWSKSKDPDAKAWQWLPESKRFVPLKN